MGNKTVAVVWVVGLALAVVVYLVGPDDFLSQVFTLADRLIFAIQQTLLDAGARVYDAIRALAIACFAVFFALSVVAAGRGLPVRWAMVIVTLLFLMLVWHEGPDATAHWTLAFVLAAVGAASMTRRLTQRPVAPPANPSRGYHYDPADRSRAL